MRHNRRLRILGEFELVVGPFAHQPEKALAERFVDFVEHVLRGAARLRERGAHAHRLAALPGKDERAHESPSDGPARRLAPRQAPVKATQEQAGGGRVSPTSHLQRKAAPMLRKIVIASTVALSGSAFAAPPAQFVREAIQGNYSEVTLGRLIQNRSSN